MCIYYTRWLWPSKGKPIQTRTVTLFGILLISSLWFRGEGVGSVASLLKWYPLSIDSCSENVRWLGNALRNVLKLQELSSIFWRNNFRYPLTVFKSNIMWHMWHMGHTQVGISCHTLDMSYIIVILVLIWRRIWTDYFVMMY